MKTILGVVLMFSPVSFSQVQSGIINYTAQMNIEHKKEFIEDIKKKDIDMNTKQSVIQMYKNAESDYYELHFTDNEAYYFKDESLELEEAYNIGSKAGLFPYYNDSETNKIIELNSMMGNISHEPLDWKTTNETKMIGDIKCYKATTTETLYSRQGHFYDRDIIAWFAPEIPVSFGPKNYSGLPGLVLEVKRKEFTITATKINLNPDEKKLKIKRVDKDEKVISQKEMNERIADMMKDYDKM
jgi:GLPGLI family protein